MRRAIFATWILIITAVVGLAERPASAGADDEMQDDEPTRARQTAAFAEREVQRYRIVIGQEDPQPLTLVPQPLLVWSNNLRGESHGVVHLWTADGRPRAVVSIYQLYEPLQHVAAEFHSLSDEAVSGERNGRRFWRPQEPGVQWQRISEAPSPAAAANSRQRQMRLLSRQFSAKAGARDRPDDFSELRLLARPVYQNESATAALFAFVSTTDPEVWLLIESRDTSDGPQWHWAAARMTYLRLQMLHEDRIAWDVPQVAPPWSNVRDPDKAFFRLQWQSPEQADAAEVRTSARPAGRSGYGTRVKAEG